jgi:GDP-mannose 6-dehydrogenase
VSHSVSVFGLGYVGSVTAACLAAKGNSIVGVDSNPQKVSMVSAGRSPVLERGLDELMTQSKKEGLLCATTDVAAAMHSTEISFVCVGTPSLKNGRLDLSSIARVCDEVGRALRDKKSFHIVVLRSTILPGTTRDVAIPALESSSGKRSGTDFAVCVNPEFIREGSAVADFHNPPFTILGFESENDAQLAPVRDLYSWVPSRIFETSLNTAEMVKYVSNMWHALKVAFANETGTLAKELGVDAEALVEIFTADTKLNISSAYLKPGFAFGGSCLPKDIRAMTYRAKELDLSLPLVESILFSNEDHLQRALDMILATEKRKIAMLGLSFKAATDDMRESPQLQLVKRLLGEGCQIKIWDDNVCMGRIIGSNRTYIETMIPHVGLLLSSDLESVLADAEVVVIGTRAVDRERLVQSLTPNHAVIDLVNFESDLRVQGAGSYAGICW